MTGARFEVKQYNYALLKCKKYFPKINLRVGEISAISTFNTKFDLIFAHSIFQYFDDYNYANSLILKMLSNLKTMGVICILDISDKSKEKIRVKEIKKKLGNKKYKIKYAKNNHLFYSKTFFKNLAKKNNLNIKIFKHSSKFNENSEYRFNVIYKIKSN